MPERPRTSPPILLYLLSAALMMLTTWGLRALQEWLSVLSHHQIRPYTIVFILPIALMTVLGGRGPGFFSLALAAIFSVTSLMRPGYSPSLATPINGTELALLLVTGTLVTLGTDAMRRNVYVLRQQQEAQARLRAVMDTAPVGLVTASLDGRLLDANPAAERMWGVTLAEAARAERPPYRMLFSDGTPTPPGQTTLARVLAGESASLSRELILERADGTRLWLDASSTLLRGEADQAVGVLVVMQDITARKHAEQELAVLLEQSQALAKRETLLNRIGEDLRASFDPEEILRRVTEALGEALHLDRCYFVSYDLERDMARLGPEWFRPPHAPIAGEYRLSAFSVNQDPTFPSGSVQRVTDTQAHQPDPSLARMGLRALLRAPLQHEGRLTVLTGAMADAPREWTDDEAALLGAVATQARAALDLAQVRQREQTIAATLQDSLRPRLPDRVPGLDLADYYQPALNEASIGGDFFDVFPLDKGLFALVVGDVSGKGLAAAAQVATVRNMLRYALYRQVSVAGAVTDLNRITSAQDLLTGFVTLFVGVYDTGRHTLTYASCGHEPGLVHRTDGEIWELEPTGPVLGAADQSVYEETTVTLAPGDMLVLYTDGISEAGRHRQDFWGVPGMASALRGAPRGTRAAEVVSHVMAGAVAHAQGDLHDDVCLLVAVVEANGALL